MRLWWFQRNEYACSSPAGLFPCQSGKQLLEKAAPYYVTAIRNLVSAPNKLYETIYFETLCRFAECCQSMPLNQISEDYSLLVQHLKRCLCALKYRQKYLLPRNADSETIAEQEPQWTYAIFSASLCYQLHHIQQDRRIILHNVRGEPIGQWQSFENKLYEPNRYFSLEWGEVSSAITVDEIISSLVKQIVPATVIQWLSQNTTLFALWWDAIKGMDSGTILSSIIQEAVNALDTKKIEVLNEKDKAIASVEIAANLPASTHTNEQIEINPVELLLTHLADLTSASDNEIHWLRIDHGLFVSSTSLNDFVIQNKQYKNSHQLINLINPALVDNAGEYYWQYRPKAFEDRRVLDGIVLKEDVLSETWKNQPINSEFQPAIKL